MGAEAGEFTVQYLRLSTLNLQDVHLGGEGQYAVQI